MTNYEVIKATSNTLKKLLETGMESLGNGKVTIGRPNEEFGVNNRINLFLYHVLDNKHLKSNDDSGLWLDLYYLLTPYYEEEVQAHEILGDAMRVLHDYPVVLPDLKIKSSKSQDIEILENALKGVLDKIKITPHPMSFDELSKVWISLKEDFRLSVVYQISVVQVGSKKEKLNSMIIRNKHIVAFPFKHPEITHINPKQVCIIDPSTPTTITILGRNLFSEHSIVKIGGEVSKIENITDEKITVEIPSNILPGPQLVEVVLKPMPEKKYGFSSNQGVFILVPMIQEITTDEPADEVVITGTKLYDPGPPELKPTLHIGGQVVKLDELISSTEVNVNSSRLIDIENNLPDSLSPIRIRINGVESMGLPCDDGKNEWMWFYNKRKTLFKDKIIKLRFPEEVGGDE